MEMHSGLFVLLAQVTKTEIQILRLTQSRRQAKFHSILVLVNRITFEKDNKLIIYVGSVYNVIVMHKRVPNYAFWIN